MKVNTDVKSWTVPFYPFGRKNEDPVDFATRPLRLGGFTPKDYGPSVKHHHPEAKLVEIKQGLDSCRGRLGEENFESIVSLYEDCVAPPQSPILHWVDGGYFKRELENLTPEQEFAAEQEQKLDDDDQNEMDLSRRPPSMLHNTQHEVKYTLRQLIEASFKTVRVGDFVAVRNIHDDDDVTPLEKRPFFRVGKVVDLDKNKYILKFRWYHSSKVNGKGQWSCWRGADAVARIIGDEILFH